MADRCPHCGCPPDTIGALQHKLDQLLEIQSGFRSKKLPAITRGVIWLINKEVDDVKDRLRKEMLRGE